jgi:hypothetical protein
VEDDRQKESNEGRICAAHVRTRKRKELEEECAALSKEVNKNVNKDYQPYVDSNGKEYIIIFITVKQN